jgi:hypothetical protein
VRRELIAALDTGTTIIPIVLPGGQLPAMLGLPYPEMLPLADIQALEISPRHWDTDTALVIESIRGALDAARRQGPVVGRGGVDG